MTDEQHGEENKKLILITFAVIGGIGAIIMFVADLILYYPSKSKHRSAASYFSTIDPGGDNLHNSTMQEISKNRVMFGGILGAVSSFFYTIGFSGSLFFGLQDDKENSSTSFFDQSLVLPSIAAVSFSLMMSFGSVYHALFVYTSFISRAIAKETKGNKAVLLRLLALHREYLRYVYKCAVVPAFVGTCVYIWCILSRETAYSNWNVAFVPTLSAPIKKMLKRQSIGGLVLCGGLTNIWNLCFFISLIIGLKS